MAKTKVIKIKSPEPLLIDDELPADGSTTDDVNTPDILESTIQQSPWDASNAFDKDGFQPQIEPVDEVSTSLLVAEDTNSAKAVRSKDKIGHLAESVNSFSFNGV